MELLFAAAEVAGAVTGLLALGCMLIRPVRDRALGLEDIRAGMKCQLRSDMLRTYYRCTGTGRIRQYELENFLACYRAYRALGGNSFIERIHREVQGWEVIT